MSRIHAFARGGALLGLLLISGGCTDTGTEVRPLEPATVRATLSSSLPTVNFRVLVDTVTRGLIENNTNAYDVPTAAVLDTFRLAVDAVRNGDPAAADAMLDKYGYDVYSIRETVTGDSLVVIRERIPAGADVPRGWGTYVFNPQFQNAADIHVNHPVDDQHSEDMAGDLYRGCRCRWFLMAGARRDANPNDVADMARATNSVFHAVHVRVAAAGTRAVSMHGFRIDNHDGELPADAEIVLAVGRNSQTTTPTYGAADFALRTALVDSGFVAGLHDHDPGYDALGATQNPQGRHSNDALGWGHWIHLEHERTLRTDSIAWKESNAAIRQWIASHPAQ
jgi:hypothetical protein